LSAIEREADAKFLDVGIGPFTDHGTPTWPMLRWSWLGPRIAMGRDA
jgi:hypothetical protein